MITNAHYIAELSGYQLYDSGARYAPGIKEFLTEVYHVMSNERIRAVLKVSLVILAGLFLYWKTCGVPHVYFQYLNDYVPVIAVLWVLTLATYFIPSAHKASQILAPLMLGISGYALLEIIYNRFCIKLPSSPFHVLDIIISDTNYYFIQRSYQYIPLLLMFIVLFWKKEDRDTSLLRGGDWNVETDVLGGNQRVRWKKVVLRISFTTFVLAIAALLLRLKLSMLIRPLPDQLMLIPSNFLGAINNCFIEEFLFRGMLLSIFSRAIGNKWGNILQAFLFGLVHFPSFNMVHYIAKIIVFSFVGWLFGRAALETGGIKSSWTIHSIIVISMYVAQTV
jgi:membrane protease YdiL (CAAX protease family)